MALRWSSLREVRAPAGPWRYLPPVVYGNGHAGTTSQDRREDARRELESAGNKVGSPSVVSTRAGGDRAPPGRDTVRLANRTRCGYHAPTEVAAMKKLAAAVLIVVMLLSVTAVPSDAWGRHGGRGCCWGGWWLPGAIFGGLALGAVAGGTYPAYYASAAPAPYYAAAP